MESSSFYKLAVHPTALENKLPTCADCKKRRCYRKDDLYNWFNHTPVEKIYLQGNNNRVLEHLQVFPNTCEQPRLPKKMGEVYWSWGLVRYCAKILTSFVDGLFQQPSLFIQFLSPWVLWTVSQFLLILFGKSSESGNFVFVNVLVLLWYCYLWSAPIVQLSWRKRKSWKC